MVDGRKEELHGCIGLFHPIVRSMDLPSEHIATKFHLGNVVNNIRVVFSLINIVSCKHKMFGLCILTNIFREFILWIPHKLLTL
jgi:hypothetical protein